MEKNQKKVYVIPTTKRCILVADMSILFFNETNSTLSWRLQPRSNDPHMPRMETAISHSESKETRGCPNPVPQCQPYKRRASEAYRCESPAAVCAAIHKLSIRTTHVETLKVRLCTSSSIFVQDLFSRHREQMSISVRDTCFKAQNIQLAFVLRPVKYKATDLYRRRSKSSFVHGL